MYSHTAVSTSHGPAVPPIEFIPTLKDLFKGQPTETLPPGAALFWEGERAGQIFEMLEGVVRIYRIMSDGRRAIMGFIHPGDVLRGFLPRKLSLHRRGRDLSQSPPFCARPLFCQDQQITGFASAALRNSLR